MIDAVTRGKPRTAMQSFSSVLSAADVAAVVDFVRREFMEEKRPNTAYHTVTNGWPNHQRYAAAFPFALGEIALDVPWEQLSAQQQAGKRIYMESCVSCHDRGRVQDEGEVWDARPLSYPRNAPPASPSDAISAASPYGLHERKPELVALTGEQRRGETLFQANCAFCHAADGTGKNWIGSFLQPHARDLTGERVGGMNDAQLTQVIREGLPGTTMSAWKNVLAADEIRAIVAYINIAFRSAVRGNSPQ